MKKLSIRIWFEWAGHWWKEVSFVPVIGTGIVPFDSELDEFHFEHDDIEVYSYTFMAADNILVVCTQHTFGTMVAPKGFKEAFKEAMLAAGWTHGDGSLWSRGETHDRT